MHHLSLKRDKNFIHDYDFSVYEKLVALFSFPKQVWLVSLLDGNSTKNFPVDLCAFLNNTIIIGVRNSNQYMQQLNDEDIFIMSTAAAEDYGKIYSLGKFLGEQNSVLQTIQDEGFALPNIICKSYKLRLEKKLKLEHQTIYISSILNTTIVNSNKKPFYHMHKIWLWKNSKTQIIEK